MLAHAVSGELLEPRVHLSGTVVYRINCGGPQVNDVPVWTADTSANPSPYVNVATAGNLTDTTTTTINMSDPSVPPGTPQAIFKSERYNLATSAEMHWAFPVTSGSYTVKLFFAETYTGITGAGQRKFNVALDGTTVLTNFDVYAAVGPFKGVVKTFNVNQTTNELDIDFKHVVENPAIKAIEIDRNTLTPGQVQASYPYLSFSSAPAGQTETHTVTLTNFANSTDPSVKVTGVSFTGANASEFTSTYNNSSPVTLAPGQSTSFNVTYTPGAIGAISASMVVSQSTTSGTVAPLTVPVSVWQLAQTGTGVTFGKSILTGTSLTNPTSLQFGPDGKLYVAQQNGLISVYTVSRTAANKYTVTNTQTITLIQSIPNHNDDGSLAPTVTTRLVTGILVVGTAANPIIYVTSSDPRIGGGDSGTFLNGDSNSGILSRLTWNGTSWTKLDLVRGLPRSGENHASNGMQLNAATNTLYIAQAGMTNMGAPSHDFVEYPEYALSSAILSVNLTAIGNTTYDLPTLVDDNAAVNANSPFGGDYGKHQAILVPGGPVQVYASGFRNPYDLVIASNGFIYTVDNGSNAGWGGQPIKVNGIATNQSSEPGVTYSDQLQVVTAAGQYFGHPNPTRASTTNTFNTTNPQSPVSVSDPQEGNFLIPGQQDGALALFPASTDGITQYTASDFGGALKGDLLASGFANEVYDIKLAANGLTTTSVSGLFNNVGSTPLDVTTEGDSAIFPGTIWTCDYDTGAITVFEPADYGNVGSTGPTFTGVDDAAVDEDGDGFSNHDEIVNGTNPTSSADQPHSWSGVKISDLLNPDDDGDGLPDTSDPFAIDASNGHNTNLPIHYDWAVQGSSNLTGLLNMGFTGLMTNGKSNYANLYDVNTLTAGGAAGVLTLDAVGSGDALGTANNEFDAFQFGINVNAQTSPFTAHTQIVAPFAGITPTAGQEMGFYFGTGDQDNYVKVVVDGGGYVKVLEEVNGVVTNTATAPLITPGPDAVDLYYTVNPQSDTVQASFTTTTAGVTSAITNVGTALPIPATWFTAATAPAVGIISTNGGGASFPATWAMIDIVPATVTQSPYGGVAAAIPGIIQAENYDNGGEGVAYHDTEAANLGGAYRLDQGVDVESTGTGGYDVGYTKAGEWMDYTVNVTATGNYVFQPRVASASTGGTFHIEIDGVNVTGTMTVPSTGAWQTYTSISSGVVNLTAGTHILKLAMDTNGALGFVGNFDSIQVATSSASTPFLGSPVALPGTIMAGNFDNGGQNIAYFDSTAGNQGGAYRSTDVDIEPSTDAVPPGLTSTSPGVGFDVGYITAGEWLQYTFSVATAGNYDFGFRIATGGAGGSFNMSVTGTSISNEVPFTNTGGWQTWQTVTAPGVALPAGVHVLRITFDKSYAPELGNFEWITVSPTVSMAETPFLGTPFTIGQTIQVDNFDNGGEGVAYHDTDGVNQGGVYRSTGVDLEPTSDVPGPGQTTSSAGEPYNVGHIAPTEYLQYTITVATTGTYSIDTRLANAGGTGTFHYAVDGANATGAITFPNTGGWQTWQTVTTAGVNLTAGQHIIRLMFDTCTAPEFGNVNWFRIYTPGTAPAMVAVTTNEIAAMPMATTPAVEVQSTPPVMTALPAAIVAAPKHKKHKPHHTVVGPATLEKKEKKHNHKPHHGGLLHRLLKKVKRSSNAQE